MDEYGSENYGKSVEPNTEPQQDSDKPANEGEEEEEGGLC